MIQHCDYVKNRVYYKDNNANYLFLTGNIE